VDVSVAAGRPAQAPLAVAFADRPVGAGFGAGAAPFALAPFAAAPFAVDLARGVPPRPVTLDANAFAPLPALDPVEIMLARGGTVAPGVAALSPPQVRATSGQLDGGGGGDEPGAPHSWMAPTLDELRLEEMEREILQHIRMLSLDRAAPSRTPAADPDADQAAQAARDALFADESQMAALADGQAAPAAAE
jgi:hypothetical protein